MPAGQLFVTVEQIDDGVDVLEGGPLSVSGTGSVVVASGSMSLAVGGALVVAGAGSVVIISAALTLQSGGPLSVSGAGSVVIGSSLVTRVGGPLVVTGAGSVIVASGALTGPGVHLVGPILIAGDGRVTVNTPIHRGDYTRDPIFIRIRQFY